MNNRYEFKDMNNEHGYYMAVDTIIADEKIVEEFDLSLNFYFNIGLQFNGFIFNNCGLYFKNKKDIIKFMDYIQNNLDSLLVLQKLEGENNL